MRCESTLLRVSLVLFLCCFVSSTAYAIGTPTQFDENGNPIFPICGTQEVWKMKQLMLPQDLASAAACATEGACDDPATRDTGDQSAITVGVIVHVINDGNGTPPGGVTQTDVDAQMAQMNADYAPYGIQFDWTTEFHNDSDYYCIARYGGSGVWWSDIQNCKARYFHDTDTNLNILVTCQDPSPRGVLLGIATFPWDPDALTNLGGLWVNSAYFGAGQKTATHETGHCLGLWHTHHGVSETAGCTDVCYENTHPVGDPAADYVGDFCADTPPTPTNYYCTEPSGTDCLGLPWTQYGSTQPENFMGYAPDDCYEFFTTNQEARMHCWTRGALPDWVGGGGCTDPAPDAPSALSANAVSDSEIDIAWADNASNEDGFRIERDSGGGFAQIATVGANVTSYDDTGLGCETSYTYRVLAYNCGGDSGYSNTAGAVTGTCPVGPTMHVSDISLTLTIRNQKTATAYVTIVDQTGSPVVGATVYITWSGSISASQSAITASDGRARFVSPKTKADPYCFILTVDDVAMAGATYDAGANVETSDQDGNGCGTARVRPGDTAALSNHPNPFNPTTTFDYTVPSAGDVTLKIYDVKGRLVTTLVNEHKATGVYRATWNGISAHGVQVASGIYYARLVTATEVLTHRIVMLK